MGDDVHTDEFNVDHNDLKRANEEEVESHRVAELAPAEVEDEAKNQHEENGETLSSQQCEQGDDEEPSRQQLKHQSALSQLLSWWLQLLDTIQTHPIIINNGIRLIGLILGNFIEYSPHGHQVQCIYGNQASQIGASYLNHIDSFYIRFIQAQYRRKMKLQIQQHNAMLFPTTRLPYPYPSVSIQNNSQLLKLYLKDVTFQGISDPLPDFTNQHTYKLRRIIDKVYRAYSHKELSLIDVQGLWPLLAFSFAKSGLQLYLNFQQLLRPVENKSFESHHSSIKEENFQQFDAKGYFQNNQWKDNKRFMKSLRVLERKLTKSSQKSNEESCLKLMQLLEMESDDFIQLKEKFQARFQEFKIKLKRQSRNKRLAENVNLTTAFGPRFFQQQQQFLDPFVLSEPDMSHNIMNAFTEKEYMNLHDTKSLVRLRLIQPIAEVQQENESELVANQSNNQSENQSTITIKHKQTSIGKLSSPTKRRLPNQKAFISTPKRREIKRPPRNLIIKKFFKMEESRNILLKEIKKTKKQQEKKKKRRSRIDKIQNKICYSDQEQSRKKRKKREQPRHIEDLDQMSLQSDHESRFSHNERGDIAEKELFLEQSQEIIMRRRRNQLKKPQMLYNFIEEDSYSNSYHSHHEQFKQQRMQIEDEPQIINIKYNRETIGKAEDAVAQSFKTMEKLQNLQIRKLVLDDSVQLNLGFDFNRYRHFLSNLAPKQVSKQVQKIIKQAINRQNISYDADLTLKVIATWTIASTENAQPIWKQSIKNYIYPILKHIISTNCYRSITDVLNNFFVSENNQDLRMLSKAKQYFKVLFHVGRDFTKFKLEDQLMKIFYDSLITPKKFASSPFNAPYFTQSSMISLRHPYKIAKRQFKYKLNGNQENIAFLAGSLVIESLFLWATVNQSNDYKSKQRDFLSNLKIQLKQLNCNFQPIWFDKLTRTVNKFYSCYRPVLREDYFLALVSIINLSLQKLILEPITSENDTQAKDQIQFLLEVLRNYINMKLGQGKFINILALLNFLTLRTNIRETFKEQKNNISYMAYSSILKLLWKQLMPFPFDVNNKRQAINSVFMKYVKENLQPDFHRIVATLKDNIYLPVFKLISNIYIYQLDNHTDSYLQENQIEYKEIRDAIEKLWENLDRRYDQFNRLLDLQLKMLRNNQKNQYADDTQRQIAIINGKIDKCETSLSHFLRIFLLPESSKENALNRSLSHFAYGLEFILKHNYFVKYLMRRQKQQKMSSLQSVIVEVINFWFSTPKSRCQQRKFQERYYESIIAFSRNTFDSKRQKQYSILMESNCMIIQQKLATIYGIQLIAAAQHPKPIAPPENSLMRLVNKSVGAYLPGFADIVKSVNLFNIFLEKIVTFINQRQAANERETNRFKLYLWDHLIGNSIKDIVLLVFLGSTAENSLDYKEIPLPMMIARLKRILIIHPNQLAKIRTDIGSHLFLYSLQTLNKYASITNILSQLSNQLQIVNLKDSEKDISLMLKDIFTSLKRLQQIERVKEPITIQCVRILCFIIQRPLPSSDLIKYFLKDMQLVSNLDSLITKIKFDQQNTELLLTFFNLISNMSENPHKIKSTLAIYIDYISTTPQKRENRLQHFKIAKKFLSSIRKCLNLSDKFIQIGGLILRLFFNKFCSPEVLKSSPKDIGAQRLQLFIEMMKGSLRQRNVYELMIVQDRKGYEELIASLMKRINQQDKLHYESFEKMVLTCMIRENSNIFDIKRLLGAMKNDAEQQLKTQPAKRQIYIQLFKKLKCVAMQRDVEYASQFTQWCDRQIKDLQIYDIFEDWMDIQQ